MSRTLSGNLTGRAARDEIADSRERIQHDFEKREKAKHLTESQLLDVCLELADIMEPGEYDRWWTLTPAKNFDDAAATKLVSMKSLAFEVEQEIQHDNEWLEVGELHNTADHVTVVPNRLGGIRHPINIVEEGTEPNPIIYGGEVWYPKQYGDGKIPF